MAEDESTQPTRDIPTVEAEADMAPETGQSSWEAHAAAEPEDDPLPFIGAAFAGGFVLAKILKKLGGDDD